MGVTDDRVNPVRGDSQRGAVLLDRDGVVNNPAFDERDQRFETPLEPADVELADGAIEGIRLLQSAGWPLAVVSNQPPAAKGKTTLEQLKAVHNRIVELLAADGVVIEEWQYCFHHPNGVVAELTGACDCRKPQPGMLFAAGRNLGIDLTRSWMVGDSGVDIEAGQTAGCKTVLIEHRDSAHRRIGKLEPDARVANLAEAAREIMQMSDSQAKVVTDDRST